MAAVAAAGDEQLFAVDGGRHGRRIVGARLLAGLRPPDRRAVTFVHGQETIAALALIAPAGVDHADDDQIAGHRGAGQTAAVAGDAAVYLHELPLPEDFAVLVEADEVALRAMPVDVARGRIADEVGPAQADADDVGVEDVELLSPTDLAGVGVEAHHALLLVDALADLIVDENSAVHDDRRGAAAVGGFPQEIARDSWDRRTTLPADLVSGETPF